jgi:hypothetical protein
MSTGWKFRNVSCAIALCVALLCAGWAPVLAQAAPQRAHKKAKKQEPPPPLPSGPTGPVQQVPLDKIAAVAPEVTYQNNQLTIVAPNSTLSDILRAVRKQTGADIEVPNAPERVVTHLGPGSPRDVIADLLNGSRFNYVLLGAPENEALLTRVVLVPKGPEPVTPNVAAQVPQPGIAQANTLPQQPVGQPEPTNEPEATADDNSGNAVDDNSATETPAVDADQAPPGSDQQQQIKTPQQMLQEMQQRQMQLQQQQQGQQAAPPGSGMPPHPPQEQ